MLNKRIVLNVDTLKYYVTIGRKCEDSTTCVEFDVSAFINAYGDGVATVMVKGPADANPYAVNLTREGNIISWLIKSTETSVAGKGVAVFIWYPNNGGNARTADIETTVLNSAIPSSGKSYEQRLHELEELVSELSEGGVPEADIADAVESYLTEHPIEGVTSESLATTLAPYAKTADLTTALASYVKSADLGTNIANYVNAHKAELKGDTGVKGDKGDKGDTGAKGDTGDKGDKGDTGERGADGQNGTNGTNGADGRSAYELAVQNGFAGTLAEWLESLKGEIDEEKLTAINTDLTQVKQRVTTLENNSGTGGSGTGMTNAQIDALCDYIKAHVAIDDTGTRVETLRATLKGSNSGSTTTRTLSSITAVASPTSYTVGTSYSDVSITVTAHYSDGTSGTVTGFTRSSGSVASGSNSITVSYGGKSTTVTVTGTASAPTFSSIVVTWSATSADVGTNTRDLISSVKAVFSDGSQETVTAYAVSPTTIAEGSQTVTVTYSGKGATQTITGVATQTDSNLLDNESWTEWDTSGWSYHATIDIESNTDYNISMKRGTWNGEHYGNPRCFIILPSGNINLGNVEEWTKVDDRYTNTFNSGSNSSGSVLIQTTGGLNDIKNVMDVTVVEA